VKSIQKKSTLLLPGFHVVQEILITGRFRIEEVWIAEQKKGIRTKEIIQIAGERGIPVRYKTGSELTSLFPETNHQGIVALAENFIYSDLDNIINSSRQENGFLLLIALDHITDEGNFGAIIRTAAFFGVHGLIIPKDRSAKVTSRVFKRSSGACVYIQIVRVVNLARTLDLLKKRGFWVIGTSGNSADSIYNFDWKRDVVLVLGSEEKGLSRAIKEQCHVSLSIPSLNKVESLNVAVAGGVILSEIFRQRGFKS